MDDSVNYNMREDKHTMYVVCLTLIISELSCFSQPLIIA
jgi:hypothetical protein